MGDASTLRNVRVDLFLSVGIHHFNRLYPVGHLAPAHQTRLDTYVYGSAQYSENIVATMLTTIFNFVSSVAVTSMKMFRVFNVILLCSEFMMGGMESTLS